MSRFNAAITGIAAYVPEATLTNADLEKMVDTNDEWITSRTGIKKRHILKEKGKATSDMAAEAVKELLRKTNTHADEVELVICATVTPDMSFPDTANTISYKVGMKNAYGFDLSAACSGFLFALTTGAKFIESGTHKKVIVIGADMMSSIVDYTDRTTCVIFGDAAGAVLLEPDTDGHGVIDSVLKADGVGGKYLNRKGGGSKNPISQYVIDNKMQYLYQDGRPVFKAAVNGMTTAVKEVMDRNDLSPEDINWVVPHQANMRIINAVADFMDFPRERVMKNIEKYGNTTAATLPLCLRDYEDQLKKGDNLILTAFGGGFTWGATLLKWGY